MAHREVTAAWVVDQVGSHPGQHVDKARTGRTGVHVADHHLGPGHDRRRHGPEGGLGRVTGYVVVERRRASRFHRHPLQGTVGFPDDRDPGGRHQLLGVGSRQPVLDDRGRAVSRQPSEQDAALHLGAGHRQAVLDPPETSPVDGQWSQAGAVSARHPGSHEGQGLQDPVHGAAPDRGVAVQHRPEGQPGQQPGQQPDPGPGVANVQRAVCRFEGPSPDPKSARPIFGDRGAQSLHDPAGAGHVVAVAEAPDSGRTFGQASQHQHPVRNRLVARHPDPTDQRTTRFDDSGAHRSPLTTGRLRWAGSP